jgi:hypothetical protein
MPGRQSLKDATIRIRNREDYSIRIDRLYLRYPWSFGPHILAVIDSGDVREVPLDVPACEVVSFTLRPTRDYGSFPPQAPGQEFVPSIAVELRTGQRYTSRSAQHQS